MADQTGPGLAPRKLDGEVEINVESNRMPLEADRSEENPNIENQVDKNVSENTEANSNQQEQVNEQAQGQPLTNRAQERIQTLANEKVQAEVRAQQAEAMLQRLVNVQTQQPAQNESEILAKQYRTYNQQLGYPEDPKEYASFVANNARLEAQREAQKQAVQTRESMETADLLRSYPNIQSDPTLMGAMSAQKAAAQARGAYLSYKDAADLASQDLDKRSNKKIAAQIAQSETEKNEAYVESTRGASGSRSSGTPDPEKMSLKDMEAYLKQTGNW